MSLKAGDAFPEGVIFPYIPYVPEKPGLIQSCGMPTQYKASQEFQNKKVVLVAIPGAFTPTCSERHIPHFVENVDKLKAKGVDNVIVIAMNDPFVMSAFGKANGVSDDFTLFMSDMDAQFSKSIGWEAGGRSTRYAIIVDHGKVLYAQSSEKGSIVGSDVDSVLAKL